jgi:hypothetical protein
VDRVAGPARRPRGDGRPPELHLGHALYQGTGSGTAAFVAARDGLLAAGDSGAAAEAEIILAELASYVGEHDRASNHLGRALDLIEPEHASWTKAFVLSHAARLNLLRARLGAAIALGRQALQIADSLDLDEIRVHSLNTIGTARVAAAHEYLAGNLEDAADIYARIGSRPDEAYTRLRAAEQLASEGDPTRADAPREGAVEFYRSVGAARYVREAQALGTAYR